MHDINIAGRKELHKILTRNIKATVVFNLFLQFKFASVIAIYQPHKFIIYI